MWFNLGPPFDPKWSGRPPQLLQEDWPTWEKFRKTIEEKMQIMYYDVAMTMHAIPSQAKTAKEKAMYMYPIAKRVDAVGYDGTNWHLYEVNKYAKLRSVGQAASYRALWNGLADAGVPAPTDLTYIITAVVDPDVLFVCHRLGIQYEVVK